jgi:hypothetical protein
VLFSLLLIGSPLLPLHQHREEDDRPLDDSSEIRRDEKLYYIRIETGRYGEKSAGL